LHDALEFARSGDTPIVWKLDRLARSMKQLIETVENLRLRGIGFRSLTEALDTTTQGRLVFHTIGALAEFERSLIRERTQAGLAAARRAGRIGGRPPKLTEDDLEAARALLAKPRYRRDANNAPPRRLSRDAPSLHPRRAHRESPNWELKKRIVTKRSVVHKRGTFSDRELNMAQSTDPGSTGGPSYPLASADAEGMEAVFRRYYPAREGR
jgi:Resolvase, N terminal domain